MNYHLSGLKFIFLVITLLSLLTGCAGGNNATIATGGDDPVQTAEPVYQPVAVYVDNQSGADTNTGHSPDQPWKSLLAVSVANFTPNTTIYLKRGSSWVGDLTIHSSGTAAQPIRIMPYGEGPNPVIHNPGSPEDSTTAVLIKGSWVTVQEIVVEDVFAAGIHTYPGAAHVLIDRVEVFHAGIGAEIEGGKSLVTNSYFHDMHMVLNTPRGNDDYGAVGVSLESSENEVAFNRMVNCTAPSYDFGQDGGAVEWYNQANQNYVHHNWAEENEGFLEVGGNQDQHPTSFGSVVAYNVSYHNRYFSAIHNNGDKFSQVENFRIENNTIIEENSGPMTDLFWFSDQPSAGILKLTNNIISAQGNYKLSSFTNFEHQYNLYDLWNQGKRISLPFALGVGEKIGVPMFVDAAKKDYHLQSGSPARNKGLKLNYSIDFDQKSIPVGQSPDIGAYQYQKP